MNKEILIHNEIFKQFRNTKYFCSKKGEIYSDFSQKILKPLSRKTKGMNFLYIDINFGEGQKHVPIHKIIFEVWKRPLLENEVIRHIDNNTLNNNIENLQVGSQKDNINDCIISNRRVGNTWILTIFDNKEQETLTFCPASNFIEYSGHPCKNGNIKRMFSRNWFKQRYTIISYSLCKNLEEKQGVTTNGR